MMKSQISRSMTPNPVPPTSAASNLPRRIYGPRVFGMLLAGVCVGGALVGIRTSLWIWNAVLFNALVWPHLAYRWACAQPDPQRADERNCLIESTLAGLWSAVMQFQLLPSMLVIAMPTMNAAGVGGARLLVRGLACSVAGCVVGGALVGWEFNAQPSLTAQVAAMPFLLLYPMLFGSIMYRMVRQLDRHRDALRLLSERDALSGVYNRRFFEERIEQEFDNFRRHGKHVALVMVDIDHFKAVNDVHGHTAGDEVIRKVGQVLLEQARRADVVARFGGDEFAVLLPFTDTDKALEFVQRVQGAFRALQADDHRLGDTGMSFGIALPHTDMDHHEHWVAKADAALYRVKSRQRGSVEVAGMPA